MRAKLSVQCLQRSPCLESSTIGFTRLVTLLWLHLAASQPAIAVHDRRACARRVLGSKLRLFALAAKPVALAHWTTLAAHRACTP